MALKLPPPPFLTGATQGSLASAQERIYLTTGDLQRLNRWLIEIQSIFTAGGLIEPDQVDGLSELITQVGQNTINIGDLFNITDDNTANIQTLIGQVGVLQGQVVTLQGRVTLLEARNQILNANGAPIGALGNAGDLYINNTGAAGSFLYGKIGAAWQVFA